MERPYPMTDLESKYVKIWKTVQAIPPGRVSSYGAIADLSGLPGRARLVGKCLGYVPDCGVNGKDIPWYRVLRSSGEIAFESGSEKFEEQCARLMEEGVIVKGKKVSLKEFGWSPSFEELLFSLEG